MTCEHESIYKEKEKEQETIQTIPTANYNLHKLVWLDDPVALVDYLESKTLNVNELEERDPRGNTPLILAIMLGRRTCVQILLKRGASCLSPNRAGWYPIQEATSLGDRELVKIILLKRQQELCDYFNERQSKMMRQLESVNDFYLEVHWNFQSWSKCYR
jgi:ankyrin repeat protein